MGFPDDALAPHERLVLNLHPHWWFIAKSGFVVALGVVAGIIALVISNSALSLLIGVLIVVSVVWFGVRFIQWVTTFFVLTSDRVIYRSGVIAKHGIEIPLERINTVIFNQGIFERILRLGDLEIESASKDGATQFSDIRRPSDVQREIYVQMEANENRKYDRMGQATHAAHAAQTAPPAAAAPSITDQINQLAQLRDAGHITEAEFQTKKAELLSRM